ncbi:glycosyltransferase, partial [bacterium]|nr:glycosyltransferase [bacterium]
PLDKVKNYPLFHNVCMELKKMGINVTEVYLRDIPREKVPSIFWNCDVMVLTSFSEGSPTVVKEAIAAKLPFVSVDVGDVSESCRLITFGIVEKVADPRSIAEKVLYLLGAIKDRSKLDNSIYLERIDIDNIARKIKRVYEYTIHNKEKKCRIR